jgi:hypothetical protein
MRRIIATAALTVLALPLLSGCVLSAGPTVSEERSIDDATSVVLSTGGDLTITRGEPSLTISAGTRVIDSLTAEVRDGVLHLGSKPGFAPLRLMGELSYELTLPTVESIAVEGSGDVTVDFAGATNVAVSIEGSGDIEGSDVDAESVTVSIEGSGDIELSGDTDSLDVSIEGSGDIDLEDLRARDATASIDGSGSIHVFATETLDASIGGSGTIRYSGGASVSSNVDGSGEIIGD